MMTQASHRVEALDSLRGVAALVVVFHHLGAAYRYMEHPVGLAAKAAISLRGVGHPAVIVFFVLSGFVLQLNYSTAASHHYGHYLVRRMFRILPAMFASLVLAALLPIPIGTEYGPWFANLTNADHSVASWARNALLFMARPDDMAFNPVLWSLAYEMRYSVLFPGLALLCVRFPAVLAALVLPTFYLAAAALKTQGIAEPFQTSIDLQSALIMTLFYLPVFVIGQLLAITCVRWKKDARPQPLWVEGASLLLACIPYVLLHNDIGSALTAAGIIATLVMNGRLAALLNIQPLPWLGKVSYSLYLVHFPLMMAFVSYWRIIGPAALPLTLVAALGLAELSHRFVEAPFTNLGRRVGDLVRRRTALASRTHGIESSREALMCHADVARQPSRSRRDIRL